MGCGSLECSGVKLRVIRPWIAAVFRAECRRKMKLSEIVPVDHIVPELNATNRWEAIDELVDTMVANGAIDPEARDSIVDLVKKRESSMSTGIGFGIGIPANAENKEEVLNNVMCFNFNAKNLQ